MTRYQALPASLQQGDKEEDSEVALNSKETLAQKHQNRQQHDLKKHHHHHHKHHHKVHPETQEQEQEGKKSGVTKAQNTTV